MNPEISVILPVHNAGNYLEEAVKSILNQSFRNLELILIDDHSKDGAVERLSAVWKEDRRLRILSSPSRGIVQALNFGAAAAEGNFIARMDADDISHVDRFKIQMEYFKNNPEIGIVSARVEIFRDDCHPDKGFQIYEDWLNRLCTPEDIQKEIFIESPLPHPTVILRRSVWDSLGGYRDVSWPEDYDLWLRAYLNGILMGKPDEILLKWRDHTGRLTRTDSRYSQKSFLKAKAHFLARSHLRDRAALICGTGSNGMQIYDFLTEEGCEVQAFVDVSPSMIGKMKRSLPVLGAEILLEPLTSLILGTVGSRGEREKLRNFLVEAGKTEGRDFLFAV
ncbi:MAG: glycosyltransferase [Spirochaetia bacterium]|nr:glycosyltransferase [Spirochaetia bacterium]